MRGPTINHELVERMAGHRINWETTGWPASSVAHNEQSTVDFLRRHARHAHFFGLGFIQVKMDPVTRFHFYHPEIPPFVEEPHDHRYNFVSHVLRGRLKNEMWEIYSGERYPGRQGITWATIDFESCRKDGPDAPESFRTSVWRTGQIEVCAGSSYYVSKDTFHTVKPDFSAGPCVTLVERTEPEKEFARVIRFSDESVCPFSRDLPPERLWEIVEDCLK